MKHGATKNGVIQRSGNNAGTLYQKQTGGVWYMRFSERTPDGKTKRVVWSTHTADLTEARRILNDKRSTLGFGADDQTHEEKLLEARRNIDNERLRTEKERAEREAKAKREAEDAAQTERDRRAVTFAEAFVIFRTSKRRPDSGEVTLSHYESQYNRFAEWVKVNHPDVVKMRDFTPPMAEAFIDHVEKTFSRNTRNKYLIFLRMFWRVLRWDANAQLTLDPWEGIRTLTQTPDEIVHKELTIEELARVAEVIRSGEPLPIVREKGNAKSKAGNITDALTMRGVNVRDEMRMLFAVGIYTGQRLGDCACLSWGEVDLVRGIITLTPRKTARKYARQVIIPVHPVLASILAEIPNKRRKGFVLPQIADAYANRPQELSRTILAVMRKAGIETDAQGESGTRTRTLAGFHSLRHTFSSIMLNCGVSPALVDAMLCHAKSSMTMRYFHENAKGLMTAVARLPILPQLAADAKAAQIAAKGVRRLAGATTPVGGADAPCGLLDAIRAHMDGATDKDLHKALEIIQNAIEARA